MTKQFAYGMLRRVDACESWHTTPTLCTMYNIQLMIMVDCYLVWGTIKKLSCTTFFEIILMLNMLSKPIIVGSWASISPSQTYWLLPPRATVLASCGNQCTLRICNAFVHLGTIWNNVCRNVPSSNAFIHLHMHTRMTYDMNVLFIKRKILHVLTTYFWHSTFHHIHLSHHSWSLTLHWVEWFFGTGETLKRNKYYYL